MTRNRWLMLLAIALMAVALWQGPALWSRWTASGSSTGVPAAAAPVPVTVAKVVAGDFPVYLAGLGTVQPYRTVTVHSRVDGQILKVFFKQGQMVKEGDLLVEIDKRPYLAALDQVTAKKQLDEALLANQTKDLDRHEKAGGLASTQQQIDTQRALVAQQQAQIKVDDAVIATAQTQLDYTTIASPLTGKVGFRTIDPGNIVHAADSNGIVSIVQLQPISVFLTAPEEMIPAINTALAAGVVPVDALSSDGQRTLSHGHLALIDNTVTEATGTIGMKASFANEDNALWPGLSVSTSTLLQALKQVITVPQNAIQHGPGGLFVFVVGADSKVTMQAVKVNQTGVGRAVIASGLDADQTVVVAGQYRLVPGSQVAATQMTAGTN